jgi:teichuronic acid biosynthesis glycosyltransferase TuaG
MAAPVSDSYTGVVSVVMPAYNAAPYIAEAIASVQAQTYQNWELLVVDDGSTDDTAAIVQHYSAIDDRIKYIYQKNARQSRARNNGIAQAIGNYIAFLDSDDVWFPEKLQLQLQVLADTAIDLVFGEAAVFEKQFHKDITTVLGAGQGLYEGIQGLSAFLAKNQIPMLTVVVRKEALARVGNFTEDNKFPNAEDYHLWLKMLLENCSFYGMPTVLGAYRVHAASISASDRWCADYVVEAKANLARAYPIQHDLIQSSLVAGVRKNFAELEKSNQVEFYQEIKRGLSLSKKGSFVPLITVLESLRLRKLALKVGYFILNHL